jgi:Protein of unknown function (DUF664)
MRTQVVRKAGYGAAMTAERYWREPPLAGTEQEHLLGSLERLRATFRWKADGLDDAGLRMRLTTSALSLGGLLTHLARAEDQMFGPKLTGEPMSAPWNGVDWDRDSRWDFDLADTMPAAEVYAIWDTTAVRSRARLEEALADRGLDQSVHLAWPGGRHLSLRRLLGDLIEEYGRHTGHADLLREAVDGRVGEDPPPDWAPVSGKP